MCKIELSLFLMLSLAYFVAAWMVILDRSPPIAPRLYSVALVELVC